MSGMVERVVQEIEDELGRQKIHKSWGADFSGVNPPLDTEKLARAMLKTTRVPTKAMILAGEAVGSRDAFADPESTWQAMIDAALHEK